MTEENAAGVGASRGSEWEFAPVKEAVVRLDGAAPIEVNADVVLAVMRGEIRPKCVRSSSRFF